MILRTTLFYLLFIALSLSILPTAILVTIVSCFKIRFPLPALYSYMLCYALRLAGNIRYEITGLDNIDKSRNYLVLSNHQSSWETFALFYLFRPIAPIIKKSLLYIPLIGWSLSLLKPIAIDRKNRKQAVEKVLNQGEARLNNKLNVMMFPEGTRVVQTGSKPFRKTAVMLAKKTNCYILPVAHNAGHIVTNNFFIKKTGTIRVSIGHPINSQDFEQEELQQIYSNWIIEEANNIAQDS
jgi:1-acyl-sn-glycerol-3-phosphate acyltransferase